MSVLTNLKRHLPALKPFLTVLKLSPTLPFTRYLFTLLKLTTVAIVATICAWVVYVAVLLAVSPAYRVSTLRLFGFDNVADAVRGPKRDNLSIEERDLYSVLPDHAAISDWVRYCIGVGPGDSRLQATQYAFLTPSQKLLRHPLAVEPKWPDGVHQPNRSEHNLIQLSKQLSEQRIRLIPKVRATYSFSQLATLIAIAIGMITTILVSVSATEFGRGDGPPQRLIRVLAIIFPALGTATAAVVSFYSPQAEWVQASRTLASETQLHDEIALTIWKLTCPTPDTDDSSAKPLTDNLESWSKRYIDLQTVPNASGAPGVNQGGGSSGGGSSGGGSSGGGIEVGGDRAASQ
jgi:uncharacterized membrane protein YgcG